MMKLAEVEQKFAEAVMKEAIKNGIDCILTFPKEDVLGKTISIDSRYPMENIMDRINGEYNTVSEQRTVEPQFIDILLYTHIHHPDANGWIPLFKPYDERQDGRWYMHINESSRGISLYRREGSQLNEICTFEFFDRPVNVDEYELTVRVKTAISDETAICEVTDSIVSLNEFSALGMHAMLVTELLHDILYPIAANRNEEDKR